MSLALNFDEKLQQALSALKTTAAGKYKWVLAWPADVRSRVDVAGLIGGVPRVLVEVELKKDNPVENAVKIWLWADRRKNKPILFLHAFSAHYHIAKSISRSRPSKLKQPLKVKQYERAVFIGKRMRKSPPSTTC